MKHRRAVLCLLVCAATGCALEAAPPTPESTAVTHAALATDSESGTTAADPPDELDELANAGGAPPEVAPPPRPAGTPCTTCWFLIVDPNKLGDGGAHQILKVTDDGAPPPNATLVCDCVTNGE